MQECLKYCLIAEQRLDLYFSSAFSATEFPPPSKSKDKISISHPFQKVPSVTKRKKQIPTFQTFRRLPPRLGGVSHADSRAGRITFDHCRAAPEKETSGCRGNPGKKLLYPSPLPFSPQLHYNHSKYLVWTTPK
jgi:hypothetical protein